jgi:DNA-directed RNA polymerase alpha subunit
MKKNIEPPPDIRLKIKRYIQRTLREAGILKTGMTAVVAINIVPEEPVALEISTDIVATSIHTAGLSPRAANALSSENNNINTLEALVQWLAQNPKKKLTDLPKVGMSSAREIKGMLIGRGVALNPAQWVGI